MLLGRRHSRQRICVQRPGGESERWAGEPGVPVGVAVLPTWVRGTGQTRHLPFTGAALDCGGGEGEGLGRSWKGLWEALSEEMLSAF